MRKAERRTAPLCGSRSTADDDGGESRQVRCRPAARRPGRKRTAGRRGPAEHCDQGKPAVHLRWRRHWHPHQHCGLMEQGQILAGGALITGGGDQIARARGRVGSATCLADQLELHLAVRFEADCKPARQGLEQQEPCSQHQGRKGGESCRLASTSHEHDSCRWQRKRGNLECWAVAHAVSARARSQAPGAHPGARVNDDDETRSVTIPDGYETSPCSGDRHASIVVEVHQPALSAAAAAGYTSSPRRGSPPSVPIAMPLAESPCPCP